MACFCSCFVGRETDDTGNGDSTHHPFNFFRKYISTFRPMRALPLSNQMASSSASHNAAENSESFPVLSLASGAAESTNDGPATEQDGILARSVLEQATSSQTPDAGAVHQSESQSSDEDVCPTCLEEYTDQNPKIIAQCRHHYHLGCIYEWMERSETCPTCREVMIFDETA